MITLDAQDVIESLSTHTNVTGTHRAAATYVNGVATAGATSAFTIAYAVIVPASGRQLQRLPEGRRSQETRAVYTAGALLVGAQAGVSEADLITLDGAVWECQSASSWAAAVGYYEALIQRSNTP